jgi:hypothetical protein
MSSSSGSIDTNTSSVHGELPELPLGKPIHNRTAANAVNVANAMNEVSRTYLCAGMRLFSTTKVTSL